MDLSSSKLWNSVDSYIDLPQKDAKHGGTELPHIDNQSNLTSLFVDSTLDDGLSLSPIVIKNDILTMSQIKQWDL